MVSRGFTLVELLLVMAIGAILLVIAIPGYAFILNSSRLSSLTNDLITTIHFTRSEAIKRNTRVTLCKSSNSTIPHASCDSLADWQDGWLVFVDGGVKGVIDPGDTVLWAQDRAYSAATITTRNYSQYLSYLPSGVSQGSNGLANGTMQICLAGGRRDIVINTTGRPRLDTGAC